MKDYKVRKIKDQEHRFEVEIEFLDDGERLSFGFPKRQGWEDEFNGKPKFIDNIEDQLKKRFESATVSAEDKLKDWKGATVTHKDGVVTPKKLGAKK